MWVQTYIHTTLLLLILIFDKKRIKLPDTLPTKKFEFSFWQNLQSSGRTMFYHLVKLCFAKGIKDITFFTFCKFGESDKVLLLH